MNAEQLKSLARSIGLALGGTVFGASLLAKLGITMENLSAFIDALIGFVMAALAVWGVWTKTQKNAVAIASDIVPIPVAAQAKVGIKAIDAIVTPSQPPPTNKAV